MGTISDAFKAAWRDFVTDGVPASGHNEPQKSDLRALGATIESGVAGIGADAVAQAQLAAAAASAFINGKLFDTTAHGVTGTGGSSPVAGSDYFYVATSGAISLPLYRNVAGAAVDQNFALPALGAIGPGVQSYRIALDCAAASRPEGSKVRMTASNRLVFTGLKLYASSRETALKTYAPSGGYAATLDFAEGDELRWVWDSTSTGTIEKKAVGVASSAPYVVLAYYLNGRFQCGALMNEITRENYQSGDNAWVPSIIPIERDGELALKVTGWSGPGAKKPAIGYPAADGLNAQNLCINHNAAPVDLSNVVISPTGTAATLTLVDDTAALTAAGLLDAVPSGKVYKLDNSAGTDMVFALVDSDPTVALINLTVASSAYVRGSGVARVGSGSSTASTTTFALTSNYVRQSRTFARTSDERNLSVRADPGAVVYFTLNTLAISSAVAHTVQVDGSPQTSPLTPVFAEAASSSVGGDSAQPASVNTKCAVYTGKKAAQGIAITKDRIYSFEAVSGNAVGTSATATYYAYSKDVSGSFPYLWQGTHNFGHASNLDYWANTDTAMMGEVRGLNGAEGIASIYMLPGFGSYPASTFIDFNNAAGITPHVRVDFFDKDGSGNITRMLPGAVKAAPVFCDDPELFIMNCSDTGLFYRGRFGRGSQNRRTDNPDTGWGTFIAGKGATEYNGTAQIIGGPYVGALDGIIQSMTYQDGRLYVAYSNSYTVGNIGSTQVQEVILREDGGADFSGAGFRHDYRNADGSPIDVETEGCGRIDRRYLLAAGNGWDGVYNEFVLWMLPGKEMGGSGVVATGGSVVVNLPFQAGAVNVASPSGAALSWTLATDGMSFTVTGTAGAAFNWSAVSA